jgi:hypothetical protein
LPAYFSGIQPAAGAPYFLAVLVKQDKCRRELKADSVYEGTILLHVQINLNYLHIVAPFISQSIHDGLGLHAGKSEFGVDFDKDRPVRFQKSALSLLRARVDAARPGQEEKAGNDCQDRYGRDLPGTRALAAQQQKEGDQGKYDGKQEK